MKTYFVLLLVLVVLVTCSCSELTSAPAESREEQTASDTSASAESCEEQTASDASAPTESQTANGNFVPYIRVSSGEQTIVPFGWLLWARIDNGDGTFDEIYADIPDTPDIINNSADSIPTLSLNGSVSYSVQVNGSVENVFLFIPGEDGYTKSETTFEDFSVLAAGTYYVVFDVLIDGNCDPDAPQNSFRYMELFRLVAA